MKYINYLKDLFRIKYRIAVKYFYYYENNKLLRSINYYYIERRELFRWKFQEKVPSFYSLDGLDAAKYWLNIVERRAELKELNQGKGVPVTKSI